jgi:DNA adenine methylase
VAHIVWQLIGEVKMYIEPCFGSGAVLLNRPDWVPGMKEIANDYDCMISNFWRAIKWNPEKTAYWADWPINHADLCARRGFLQDKMEGLREKVMADPEYYDVRIAGWWVWCASVWIGTGMMQKKGRPGLTCKNGVVGPKIHHEKTGGITECKRPNLRMPGHGGKGVCTKNNLEEWFSQLQHRFKSVDVVCSDWSKVCGGNWQTERGICGIFFDPPYGVKRRKNLYSEDSLQIASDIREWCRRKADNPNMRIVLAGYYEEHKALLDEGWMVYRWKAQGGYANQGKGHTRGKGNKEKESLFYSPHCLSVEYQQDLFEGWDNEKHSP